MQVLPKYVLLYRCFISNRLLICILSDYKMNSLHLFQMQFNLFLISMPCDNSRINNQIAISPHMAYYIPAPLTQEMCPKGRHFYTEKGEFDIEKTKAF